MDKKAQVAFEYLLTVLFSIIMVVAAAVLLDTIRVIAQVAKAQIITYREETITSLIGD